MSTATRGRQLAAQMIIASLALGVGAEAFVSRPILASPAQSPQQGPPPAVSPAPPTAFVYGKVVDALSNEPVADAVVQISGVGLGAISSMFSSGVGGGPRSIAVDGQGRFLFRDLPKGTRYSLSATAPGYANGSYGQTKPGVGARGIDIDDGEKVTGTTIRLWKQGSISGRVVDEHGEPMVDVGLRYSLNTPAGNLVVSSSMSTDDRGLYRADVAPGDYTVSISSTLTTMSAEAIDEYQQAMAGGPGASRGYRDALNATDAPVGASSGIRLGNYVVGTGGGRGDRSLPIFVGEGGRLFLYPTTYYESKMTANSATVVTVKSGEDKSGVDFRLTPTATSRVSGIVTGPDGLVGNIGVTLMPRDQPLTSITLVFEYDVFKTITNAKGEFTLLGVPPGDYLLRITKKPVVNASSSNLSISTSSGGMSIVTSGSAGGGPSSLSTESIYWASQPLSVGESDVHDLSVALQVGSRASGRVEFAGSGQTLDADKLSKIAISLRAIAGTPAWLATPAVAGRIDDHGAFNTNEAVPGSYLFSVSGLPPGWTLLSAIADGHDAADRPLEIGAGDVRGITLTFTDRPTKLTGAVHSNDPKAISQATVVAFPADLKLLFPSGLPGLPSRRAKTVFPGKTGAFSIDGLPPGEYCLVALPPEFDVSVLDAKTLAPLVGRASRITLGAGETKAQDVTVLDAKTAGGSR